jgi:uncharacterized alpha-E superfamily protein
VAEATMLRGEGWHFFRMGRLVERADKTSRLLDVKYYILLPSLTDVGTPVGMYRNPAEQRLGQLRSELAYADTEHIIKRGLHEFLDGFQTKLNLVDQCIYDTFFALRPIGASAPYRPNQ